MTTVNVQELEAKVQDMYRRSPRTRAEISTHFAGSACGAGLSGKPSSTVAFEKRWNALLGADRDTFVDRLSSQPLVQPPGMQDILRFNQGRG